MEKAVIGIIGCGNIAKDVHLENAFTNSRIRVKWCTGNQSPNKENADTLILQLKDYIDTHLHETLTLEALADKVHFNKTYFVQRFKSLWGVPPMKYVSNLRCQKAMYLLLETDLPISAIAERTGFQSPHYFSAVFKKYTRRTPNDFRKQEKEDPSNISRSP